MLEHHFYLGLLLAFLAICFGLLIWPAYSQMFKTRRYYKKLYAQRIDEVNPELKDLHASTLYNSQSHLVEAILSERSWEYFTVTNEIADAFLHALCRHVTSVIPFVDTVHLPELRKIDMKPYHQLLEYYINSGKIPSLEKWYEDYGWKKKDHQLKMGRTVVQLDHETIELIKCLDAMHRPVLIELRQREKHYA